jgi:putative mRNA 3-end processing factor
VRAPPAFSPSSCKRNFNHFSLGFFSGWMALRGAKNRRAVDQGFILSDHVDWPDLNRAVKESEAEKVYVTHGYTSIFSRWLNENGVEAGEVTTMYGNEEETEDRAKVDGPEAEGIENNKDLSPIPDDPDLKLIANR